MYCCAHNICLKKFERIQTNKKLNLYSLSKNYRIFHILREILVLIFKIQLS